MLEAADKSKLHSLCIKSVSENLFCSTQISLARRTGPWYNLILGNFPMKQLLILCKSLRQFGRQGIVTLQYKT